MKVSRNFLIWIFLVCLGCPSSNEKSSSQTETPKTQAVSAKKEPEKAVETKTPKPETTSVLFVVTNDGRDVLLPLLCYDANKKEFLAQKDCFSLPALGDSVKLTDGRSLTLKTKSKYDCGPNSDPTPGFLPEKMPEGEELELGMIALWPESVAENFTSLAKTSDDTDAKSLAKEERDRLLQGIKKNGVEFKPPLILKQSASLDFNGDGTLDTLYSVYFQDTKNELDKEFSGSPLSALFFFDGKKPDTLQVVSSSGFETFILDGYIDLNRDKIPEVWLSTDYHEGTGDALVQWKNGQLETLGGWGCGS